MKKFFNLVLVAAVMAVSAIASAEATYTIYAGNNSYTPIQECGYNARAKAVYSGATGVFSLRVCDNTLCRWPLMINTNAKFEPKQETSIFYSKNEPGIVHLNGECYEFPLTYRLQPNQRNIRAVFGHDTLFQNKAKLDIKL